MRSRRTPAKIKSERNPLTESLDGADPHSQIAGPSRDPAISVWIVASRYGWLAFTSHSSGILLGLYPI
jgi:hypothetical protein